MSGGLEELSLGKLLKFYDLVSTSDNGIDISDGLLRLVASQAYCNDTWQTVNSGCHYYCKVRPRTATRL